MCIDTHACPHIRKQARLRSASQKSESRTERNYGAFPRRAPLYAAFRFAVIVLAIFASLTLGLLDYFPRSPSEALLYLLPLFLRPRGSHDAASKQGVRRSDHFRGSYERRYISARRLPRKENRGGLRNKRPAGLTASPLRERDNAIHVRHG